MCQKRHKLYITLIFDLACRASDSCVNSLCDGKTNGHMYRISDDKPGYFVQCSNGFAYCFQCPSNLVFDNHLRVCVFPNRGSGGSGGSGENSKLL